ncbi:MAG: ABC transporter permease [Defluviitaleaceae bacterium]|nr:ABC transporter permease [Defluviitaleaceae bacterium]
MKLTAKLAYSQLIVNRKRTIFTLLGIILSTAIIMIVCTLVTSGTNSVMLIAGDPVQHEALFALLLIPAIISTIIIVVMSVIVISNGFRVSANERVTQFGILKSVGATKRQITATVMYESIFLSMVGIPIGIILGLFLAFWTVQITNHFLYDLNNLTQIMIETLYIYMNFTIAWKAIAIAMITSFVTVLFSAWKPARKAARLSAIDSIRGVGQVNVKKIRTNPLVGKIFGFEGTLAAKSLKRSRGNFRASVSALTIAIILFVIASGIAETVGRIEDMMFGALDGAVQIEYLSARHLEFNEKTGLWEANVVNPIDSRIADVITERLSAFENTQISASGFHAYLYTAAIPQEMLSPQIRQWESPDRLTVNIITRTPNDYARLIEVAGVPHGSNILLNFYSINNRGNITVIEPLQYNLNAIQMTDAEGEVHEMPVHAILAIDNLPYDLRPFTGNPAASVAINLIVPYGYMRAYGWTATPMDIPAFMAYARTVMDDFFPLNPADTIAQAGFRTMIFEAHDFVRLMNLGIIIASVFVYSFIVILTLIGLTSVISTISTNVRMRSREFAVLQSVGMTYGGIKHMLNLESIMCSAKSLLWGLPIAILLTYLIHLPISSVFPITYQLPWLAVTKCVAGVFAITWITMRFSASRLRNESIIDRRF